MLKSKLFHKLAGASMVLCGLPILLVGCASNIPNPTNPYKTQVELAMNQASTFCGATSPEDQEAFLCGLGTGEETQLYCIEKIFQGKEDVGLLQHTECNKALSDWLQAPHTHPDADAAGWACMIGQGLKLSDNIEKDYLTSKDENLQSVLYECQNAYLTFPVFQ